MVLPIRSCRGRQLVQSLDKFSAQPLQIFLPVTKVNLYFTSFPMVLEAVAICFRSSFNLLSVLIKLPSYASVILQIWEKFAPEHHSKVTSTSCSLILPRY